VSSHRASSTDRDGTLWSHRLAHNGPHPPLPSPFSDTITSRLGGEGRFSAAAWADATSAKASPIAINLITVSSFRGFVRPFSKVNASTLIVPLKRTFGH